MEEKAIQNMIGPVTGGLGFTGTQNKPMNELDRLAANLDRHFVLLHELENRLRGVSSANPEKSSVDQEAISHICSLTDRVTAASQHIERMLNELVI